LRTYTGPNAVNFIPFVGALAGGTDATATTVAFNFGADGKLVEIASNVRDTGMKTGLLNRAEN